MSHNELSDSTKAARPGLVRSATLICPQTQFYERFCMVWRYERWVKGLDMEGELLLCEQMSVFKVKNQWRPKKVEWNITGCNLFILVHYYCFWCSISVFLNACITVYPQCFPYIHITTRTFILYCSFYSITAHTFLLSTFCSNDANYPLVGLIKSYLTIEQTTKWQ